MSSRFIIFFLSCTGFLVSCKKEQTPAPTPPPVTATPTPTPTSDDVIKDSVLYYTRDIYLWNTQVPATFDAKSYGDPSKIMEAIQQYSIEPGFPNAVDRFSFAMKKDEWDAMSAGLNYLATTTTNDGDFGMTVFFRAQGDLRVRMVEPASPAGKAGIKRGWQITKIDGSTDITTGNSDFIVDHIYEAASSTVTFLKPDGTSVNINLSQGKYAEQPIYLDTVYSINNKKIGYFVFNSFLGKTADMFNGFSKVFGRFASAGVTDVIIDLRYNGGGYVSVQEKLANYLIKSSANGSLMMKEEFNAGNSANNSTTNFKKEGSLNLSKVYFIVGSGTASASELVINNLKPYMDVRLIGATTYGKPVGFFPIAVGDWYIFPVSFRTTNKNGEGNYFDGLTVNSKVADGLDRDWGDVREARLASAIRNITTGAYRMAAEPAYDEPAPITNANKILDAPFLKTTIADGKILK